MCTYLYAAFSLKEGEAEGLTAEEAAAVARWKRTILDVAIDEMGHLVAVWNITAAVGGAPRFGRENFPLSSGLSAGRHHREARAVQPGRAAALRASGAAEGLGRTRGRGLRADARVQAFGAVAETDADGDRLRDSRRILRSAGTGLKIMADKLGEKQLFCGDPGAAAFTATKSILAAPSRCCARKPRSTPVRRSSPRAKARARISRNRTSTSSRPSAPSITALRSKNPNFAPAHPAAHNPVLRRPPNPEGRVWIDDPDASAIVDIANACYQLMLRLIGYAYGVPSPSAEKSLAVDLGIDLMKALAMLGESAARRPAGKDNPQLQRRRLLHRAARRRAAAARRELRAVSSWSGWRNWRRRGQARPKRSAPRARRGPSQGARRARAQDSKR